MDLIELLKRAQANTFAMYLKTHNFHWNVEGMLFAQFHDFFNDLYTELWEAVDTIAELIRGQDAYAPGSLGRFAELSSVQDENAVPSTRDMVMKLLADNDIVRASLYDALRAAANEQGVANALQDRITAHDKHAWMLRSFLKQI
jgi:starvation-inducible DNA-binding protein